MYVTCKPIYHLCMFFFIASAHNDVTIITGTPYR